MSVTPHTRQNKVHNWLDNFCKVQYSHLLLSWLGLQDVLLPDGVEHAALFAEVSETVLFTVPVHLHDIAAQRSSVCVSRIVA